MVEAEILRRAKAGDRQAHAELYRAHAPMVFSLALNMLGSPAEAQDVVQDSFVEVIRKADQFRGDAGIRGWIKQIAINKCLSSLRSPWTRRRRRATETDVPSEPARERSTDLCLELLRALDALSATPRAVVWLHDVEGYTHREIGRLMGRSTSFSKSQLARAHALLRERLNPEDPEAGSEACLGLLKTV